MRLECAVTKRMADQERTRGGGGILLGIDRGGLPPWIVTPQAGGKDTCRFWRLASSEGWGRRLHQLSTARTAGGGASC